MLEGMPKDAALNDGSDRLTGLTAHRREWTYPPSSLSPDALVRLLGECREFLATPHQTRKKVPSGIEAYLGVQWEQHVRQSGFDPEAVPLSAPVLHQLVLFLSTTFASTEQTEAKHEPSWLDCLFDWFVTQLVRQQAAI